MSKLTINKDVPLDRAKLYVNLGWVEIAMHGHIASMRKVMETASGFDTQDYLVFKKPYLVQRAKIVRPFSSVDGATFTTSAKMDYMGSAEFEFGALPRSLRRIESQWLLYRHYTFDSIVTEINQKDYPLRVYANFDNDEQRDAYESWMTDIFTRQSDLKEYLDTSIKFGKVVLSDRTDLWWDIENDVLFSFDRHYMTARLEQHLRASFERLQANLVLQQTKETQNDPS